MEFHLVVQYPRVGEEHEPLSSHNAGASTLSTGLLVDTNLETSIPDTYRPPPTPIPYDSNLVVRPRTPPVGNREGNNKPEAAAAQRTDTENVEEANTTGTTNETEAKDLKDPDCKVQADIELVALKEVEDELEKSGELKKSGEPIVSAPEEEECCPTCLEGNTTSLTMFLVASIHSLELEQS